MSPCLREPFFLRGRTGVLQRAVILSLVLGVLSAAAGFVILFLFVSWSADRPSELWIEMRGRLGFPVLLLASGLPLNRRDGQKRRNRREIGGFLDGFRRRGRDSNPR